MQTDKKVQDVQRQPALGTQSTLMLAVLVATTGMLYNLDF